MQFAPMRMFICKVASRCNLDCDYCYVYRHADQSWREQPAKMSVATAQKLGERIKEHSTIHNIKAVDVVMHGGEPLLAGVDHLRHLCESIQEHAYPVEIYFGMQTNGLLFDERVLEFCLTWNFGVGLSLDGPREVNDLHRLDHKRRSSFDGLQRALQLLSSAEGQRVWSGFLSVIDLGVDPIEVYTYLSSFNPKGIDFLLPLGNHLHLPPGKEDVEATPYADWLLKVFHTWYRERPQAIKIRRFRDVIALLAGVTHTTEEWGLHPVDFVVVETNGEIQAVDTLKTTYPGANRLGLNIFQNSFDELFTAPLIMKRQNGWAELCETCQQCELVNVCGGGYFPQRYSVEGAFRNPSIYCSDLKKLIREIHATVADDINQLRVQGWRYQP